jgi:hypothetical protein
MLVSAWQKINFGAKIATCALPASVVLSGIGAPAWSAVVTFEGIDFGLPGNPRPRSDAAAARFDAAASALGNVNLIDFENVPLGRFSSLTVAPGVTVELVEPRPSNRAWIEDNSTPFIAGEGFNTTVGGNQFLQFDPGFNGTLKFSFETPVQAFGSYLTDVGGGFQDLSILFNDGTSQVFPIERFISSNAVGIGVGFFGFTDAGKSITDVSFELKLPLDSGDAILSDTIGIDDVRYVPVPEPLTILGSSAALGIGAFLKRQYSRKQ